MSDGIQESVYELLQKTRVRALAVDQLEAEAGASDAYCSTTKLFAKTQFSFYVAFQLTVLALAIGVASALILFILRLTDGVDVTGVVGTLGALATGAAAGFLQKAASAAKSRYEQAMKALKDSDCI